MTQRALSALQNQGASVENSTSAPVVTYRRITGEDADAAHKLSRSVRWPHRLEDWKFILRLGAGFVAETEQGIIGTAMCWSHGAEFASLGMVIVDAGHQGLGTGRELMTRVMGELGKRNVLLHATESGAPLYAKLGFVRTGEIHQHQGTVFKPPLMPLQPGERIRPLGARDGARLAALGARAAGMPRATVMSALLESAECVVIDRYDEMIGCAMLRRFGHGYAIGPVIAPDVERAKALIAHWAGTYAGAFLRIDVGDSGGLGDWLTDLGLVQVDSVMSMVRGEAPLADSSLRQYAIVSQALG
jgi:predicted N-acetyltransferase YhbS